MRRSISILTVLSILAAMTIGAFPASAQQPLPDLTKIRSRFRHKLPKSFDPHLLAQAKAAYDSSTAEQRQQLMEKIRARSVEVRERAKKEGKSDSSGDYDSRTPFHFSDKHGHSKAQTHERLKKGDKSLLGTFTNMKPNALNLLAQNKSLSFRNHASRAQQPTYSSAQVACRKTIEQFIRDFYLGALVRQPNSSELSYWQTQLTQAQSQGQAELLTAARSLGYTLFGSAEYAGRGRGSYDFVYDCYEAFLQRYPDQSGWDFWTNNANQVGYPATVQAFIVCGEFEDLVRDLCIAAVDADSDGLPDSFESALTDEFTPEYHIATAEPQHFARFGDYQPQTVIQTVSPYSPISHYRVTPLGTAGGLGYLRVDYMTLWDNDGGFDYSSFCLANIALTEGTLGGDIGAAIDLVVYLLGSHSLDNERSAMLVAAPLANGSYNTDSTAYSIYSVFLSAHLGEPGDRSAFYAPVGGPIPAGGYSHAQLSLSRSKHATDPFDPYNTSYPEGLPLVPWYIIDASFFTLYLLYYYGYISFIEYLISYYAFINTFFVCIVEHFDDSGPTYAQTRINVGEVSNPINGSHFIQGGSLYTQLTTPLW